MMSSDGWALSIVSNESGTKFVVVTL